MFHVSDLGRNEVKENAMAAQQQPLPVKLEIVEDPLEEEFGSLNKRSKTSAPFHQELQQQLRPDSASVSSQHATTDYNPFNEPSPLGLRLRKSPSLLDLIQMKLSQTHSTMPCSSSSDYHGDGKKKDSKSTVNSGTADKLKASNFPASLLRIGTWEYISRYEGDLVAKCYFAKHKLVWEVLDGGLKSKIEIQWSDIIVLKASCQENKPGTLDLVLSRQPLFFKETNPQPRKHTLWQATSDFTGGQASIHRKHFLQCAPGLLGKHFDKLIQCDPRLYSLSQQPDIVLDSPYFESKCSVLEDQEEPKSHIFNHVGDYGQSFSAFHDVASTCSASPTSSRSDARDPTGRVHDYVSRETPSPSSVMDTRSIEELTKCETEELKDDSHWDQFKVPGLHQSMSVNDLVNHIGNCITGQMSTDNPLFAGSTFSDKENKKMLEDITQYLLGDSQTSSASDENSLMSRVNSLCCLLQKDPSAVQNLQPVNKDEVDEGTDDEEQRRLDRKPGTDLPAPGHDDASPRVQASMSRKDSIGDFLLNLPRIASLSQFLFNISEDA